MSTMDKTASPGSISIAGGNESARAQEAGENSTAVQLLRHSLNTFLAKDIRAWAELCAEDVVVEFPFSPDETSKRMTGRAAIYDYLKDYPSVIDLQSTPTMAIYAMQDPCLAIAEWSVSGRVISNGNPYEMSYATFATFKDGLIVGYREYWNPMAFLKAMSGTQF